MADVNQFGGPTIDLTRLIAAAQATTQALNNLNQTINTVFPVSGGTTSTANAGSATLPSNPVGFILVTLPDGTICKVPYYAE